MFLFKIFGLLFLWKVTVFLITHLELWEVYINVSNEIWLGATPHHINHIRLLTDHRNHPLNSSKSMQVWVWAPFQFHSVLFFNLMWIYQMCRTQAVSYTPKIALLHAQIRDWMCQVGNIRQQMELQNIINGKGLSCCEFMAMWFTLIFQAWRLPEHLMPLPYNDFHQCIVHWLWCTVFRQGLNLGCHWSSGLPKWPP